MIEGPDAATRERYRQYLFAQHFGDTPEETIWEAMRLIANLYDSTDPKASVVSRTIAMSDLVGKLEELGLITESEDEGGEDIAFSQLTTLIDHFELNEVSVRTHLALLDNK